MNKIVGYLKKAASGPTEEAAKRAGIPVGDLVARGLLRRHRTDQKKYLVPEGAPRWATKFRHSRKKYGVEEHVIEQVIIKLTDRGARQLKSHFKVKSGEIDNVVLEDTNQQEHNDEHEIGYGED